MKFPTCLMKVERIQLCKMFAVFLAAALVVVRVVKFA